MERKVALITGASKGIGSQIALSMAKEGYNIVVNYNGNKDSANAVVEACKEQGVEAFSVRANVSVMSDVEEMFKQAMDTFGRIDCLVNNSGITKDTLLLRMSEEDFMAVMDVNLKGCFNCTKLVSKIMMKQRSGSIINMASVIGLIGNIGQSNYAASKAGMIGFTKSIARELAPRGIRVNAVAPGFIQTEMTDTLSDTIKQNILAQVPFKKFGTCEDVANTVVFLASDNSKYITGQTINVDGGMVM